MTIHSLVPLRICNKKGTFWVFTGFGHLRTSETSGRNMTIESAPSKCICIFPLVAYKELSFNGKYA